MKIRILVLLTSFALFVMIACSSLTLRKDRMKHQEKLKYEASWNSLQQHDTPKWLLDAKFGIYSHWGAQSVMHDLEQPNMPAHEAIEQWKGENFDPAQWAELFQRAGAQFAGPVAWHVNGCLNWDSKLTDWNSVKHGPHRDIFGELAREIRKRGMKVMASFHSSTLWGPMCSTNPLYLSPEGDYSRHGKTPGVHGVDGRYTSDYLKGWLERMTEAYTLYRPDMVWLDVGFGGTVGPELRRELINGKLVNNLQEFYLDGIREDIQQKYIAGYFNAAMEWGKEVELIYKSYDIPPGIGMRDIENGNLDGLQFDPWMADINMQQHRSWPFVWFYNPKNPIKDANTLVDMLIDITSKNGRMLLNVPSKADGSFAENIKEELYKIGDWLQLNGEAIYGTTPWVIYGEGPSEIKHPGHHGQGKRGGLDIPQYQSSDIRFTRKDDVLYALVLDWPENDLAIHSLGFMGKLYKGQIKSVTLLGSNQKLNWRQLPKMLLVDFPQEKPCDFAYVLKIQLNKDI